MLVVFTVIGSAVALVNSIRRADFSDQALAKFIPTEETSLGKLERDRKCARFPRRAENVIGIQASRLDDLVQCRAAHLFAYFFLPLTRAGAAILVTPTIESRVTISASSSAVIPSVPAGRSGITR